MMNRGVAISYGDVAPGAKENFSASANETEFDSLKQFNQYNLNFPNYANPCEYCMVALDGTAVALPPNANNVNVGLWSKSLSRKDGTFQTPIVLTLQSVGQYSSQGLTFTFDTYNGIYATRMKIEWFSVTDNGETAIESDEFTPNNSMYFCQKKVDYYNKIVITFYSINMPYNRLRLRTIDYGYGTIFYGEELRNTKLMQEINPISTDISINTADFTLDSKSQDIEYSFQQKQPLSIYYNGQLKATTFVKTSKRKAKFLWDIQSEDYIGLMNSIPYYGGMYNGDTAYSILEDIFKVAKVPYTINENLKNMPIYGYIPFTNCREALMHVAFAVQNVVDTSNRADVAVFELLDDTPQTIPGKRIMQGQSFDDGVTVTGVEVAMHTYTPLSVVDEQGNANKENRLTVFWAEEDGTGKNIFVKFPEPLHDVYIEHGTFAKDKDGNYMVGTNYAVIEDATNEYCVVKGYKYEHKSTVRRKNNDKVLESEIENVITIENATLVSKHNIQNVLDKCFDWLSNTKTANMKIVEGKHVQYGKPIKYGEKKYGTFKYGEKHPNIVTYDKVINLGDIVQPETEYLKEFSGRSIKQSFNLNGNIVVKEVVLK